MGGAACPLHDAGNDRSIERGSDLQAARRGSLTTPAKPAGERESDTALTPRPGTRSNLLHTFSNSASRINPSNVGQLEPRWTFSTTDAISASPTVVDGALYVGSWDGFFYAINVRSGKLLWKFQVDCDNTIVPVPPHCLAQGQTPPPRFFTQGGLITSTAAVAHEQVYFAAGKTVYDLDAEDGKLRWKHVICGNPEKSD